jgi:ankyrin repeat protein
MDIIRQVLGDNSLREKMLEKQNAEGETPLLVACMSYNFSAAMALLDAGANATTPSNEGETPLHSLYLFSKEEISALIPRLLEHGADVKAYSKYGYRDDYSHKTIYPGTPLHRAVGWNNVHAVQALLDAGADPLEPGTWQKLSTPLWIACSFHLGEVAETILNFLSKRIDVKSLVNGGESGDWPLIAPVLDQGYYYLNGSALGRIMRHGERYKEETQCLIGELHRRGSTLLLRAQGQSLVPCLSQSLQLRCADVVQVLLDLAPSHIDHQGGPQKQTPLHFAVEQDRLDLVELLLSRGAKAAAVRGDGTSVLNHYANYHGSLDIAKALMKHGAEFELPPVGFQTPFFGSVARGNFDLARFILDNTPKPDRHKMINAPCFQGLQFRYQKPGITLLGYLLYQCDPSSPRLVDKLYKLVGDCGEKVSFVVDQCTGQTALQLLATYHQHIRNNPVVLGLVKKIVERHRSPEEMDYTGDSIGKTALWLAARSLNYDVADVLLSAGADATKPNSDGDTVLELIARQLEHTVGQTQHQRERQTVEEMSRLFKSYGHKVMRTPSMREGTLELPIRESQK